MLICKGKPFKFVWADIIIKNLSPCLGIPGITHRYNLDQAMNEINDFFHCVLLCSPGVSYTSGYIMYTLTSNNNSVWCSCLFFSISSYWMHYYLCFREVQHSELTQPLVTCFQDTEWHSHIWAAGCWIRRICSGSSSSI